jgi:AAA domain
MQIQRGDSTPSYRSNLLHYAISRTGEQDFVNCCCALAVAIKIELSVSSYCWILVEFSLFVQQVLALRAVLRASNLGGINVGVVEDFQGQEAKVVLISTVLTREHDRWNRKEGEEGGGHRLGFLHDPKRFNVAITRAHALCIIVGHAGYLEQSGTYWAALMDHIRRNDGILGEEVDADGEAGDEDDIYGVADLLRRVDELQLLGRGAEEDMHDLAFYYSDVPQWKVMLS